ncbi:hypothetical protein [Mycobacterium sp. ZZG]
MISDSFVQAVVEVVLAPVRFVGAVARDDYELVSPPARSVPDEATAIVEPTTKNTATEDTVTHADAPKNDTATVASVDVDAEESGAREADVAESESPAPDTDDIDSGAADPVGAEAA